MSARIQSTLLFLSLASLAAPACHSSPKGVRVDLDMAGFETTAHALRLTVSADPGGFAANSPSLPDQSVAISYNDTDDLVMTFDARQGFKFTGKISFRLDTGNTHPLTISAVAEAFNVTGAKIASGKGSGVALPAGGDAELSIMLSADSDGTTADTTVVDLATTAVDGAITGPSSSAPPATVAICDVLGSNSGGAVVIGVPGASVTDHAGRRRGLRDLQRHEHRRSQHAARRRRAPGLRRQ